MNKSKQIINASFVCGIFLLFNYFSSNSIAEIYRYIDENGVMHFTNAPLSSKSKLFMREGSKEEEKAKIKNKAGSELNKNSLSTKKETTNNRAGLLSDPKSTETIEDKNANKIILESEKLSNFTKVEFISNNLVIGLIFLIFFIIVALLIKKGQSNKETNLSNSGSNNIDSYTLTETTKKDETLPEKKQYDWQPAGIACPKVGCKGIILEKESSKSNTYYGCSKYPECDFVVFDKPIGTYCPQDDCGGLILEKESRAGRRFYGCSNFPKCRFTTSLKPVSFPCPDCGANFLVEKDSYENGLLYVCINCRYKTIAEDCYN